MILHVDMDAFFASVEKLDNPELRDQCVIVGGVSDRGVVSAASYEARRYGVKSAMPMYKARQLCLQGVFLPPRGWRYKEMSRIVMGVLSGFSPLVEPVSIDEAYVDIAGCRALFGGAESIGRQIKQKIGETTGLTCSVGIAPQKFLAKIASDMDKPDGLVVIPPESAQAFIDNLPVEKVPGVGSVSNEILGRMGIRTMGDVRRFNESALVGRLGKFGVRLAELARGIDRSRVRLNRPVKSVSSEETLSVDTRDRVLLQRHLLAHAEDVAWQLRRKSLRAKTVFIKVKHSDFTQATRQAKLEQVTQSSDMLYRASVKLLDAYRSDKPVRLIGLGAAELIDAKTPVQQTLFAATVDAGCKWEKLDGAIDAIWEKYGRRGIARAAIAADDPGESETDG